jgi:hypothetical protein
MFGRSFVLCASWLLALPWAASAQRLPVPEEKPTQWHALMWPDGGGCTAVIAKAEDRNSFLYRAKVTRTLGPYLDAQVATARQGMSFERQNSNSDRWAGKSGCYSSR